MRAAQSRARLFLIGGSVAVVVFMGVLVGGSYFAQAGRPKKDAAAGVSECKQATDCLLVPDDCCGCSQGGKQRVVAKGKAEAYEKARQKRCAGTMCAAMMSQDPSCSMRATCSKGLCALAAETATP